MVTVTARGAGVFDVVEIEESRLTRIGSIQFVKDQPTRISGKILERPEREHALRIATNSQLWRQRHVKGEERVVVDE